VNSDRCLGLQRTIDIDLGVRYGAAKSLDDVMGAIRRLPETEFLRVVDYVVGTSHPQGGYERTLEEILSSARSKWAVGERLGRVGLIERVPEGVRLSVEGTIASSETAGHVLARAWSAVHGLVANDSGAYQDAVRAVEIAAIEIVEPSNSQATLGTVIGRLEGDGDWGLRLREHSKAPHSDLILSMCRTLWFGHRDRHGSVDYSVVTHEEARAAVVLAATLVDWFSSGSVARRPPV
jgi:hypothetical protein